MCESYSVGPVNDIPLTSLILHKINRETWADMNRYGCALESAN